MCDSGSVVRRRDWHRNHRMYLWIRSGNRHVSPENPREDIRLAGKWESGLKVSGSLNVPKIIEDKSRISLFCGVRFFY